MRRRDFLAVSAAYGVHRLLPDNPREIHADGLNQCGLIAPGVVGCRVQLPFPSVMLADTLQQCPEWCWAASISMVFKFFGHPLDQKEIVMQQYQQVVCMPALTSTQIASDLSRSWQDDKGVDFTSQLTAAYDAQAGVFAIDNAIVVNELTNRRPLLYCNTHHAMVVCGVSYRPGPAGPIIDRVDVMDPWPSSPRIHPLSPLEMVPAHMQGQMMFLAAVAVT